MGSRSRGRGEVVTRGADLSHLGPEPELRSVIEDPRCDDDLLRAPDPDAFGAFYARHARAVEAFFARRTGDRVLALRPRGETFAAALVARRRFRPGGAPARAWLYTIAARRLADHRRRAAAEERLQQRLMAHRRTEARARTRRPPTRRSPAGRWRCSSGCRTSSARRSPRTSWPGTATATIARRTRRVRGRRAPARLARARHHAPAGAGAPGGRARARRDAELQPRRRPRGAAGGVRCRRAAWTARRT